MHQAEHIESLSSGLASSFGASYYRARYYDTQTGRFIGEDPSRYGGNSVNFYENGYNNPVNFIDPSGRQPMFFGSPGQALTTSQNLMSWSQAFSDAWDMTADFITGTGPEHRDFGPSSVEVSYLKYSPGMNAARNYFNAHNCQPINDGGHKFGLSGLVNSGLNPTLQFIGSYNWTASPKSNGTVTFTIRNETSLTSLLYQMGVPSHDRSSFKPFGTITQTFHWTEPMTGDGCGCK
jgi:RHS repeat-associated protein